MKLLKQPVGNRAVGVVVGLLVMVSALWLYIGYAMLTAGVPGPDAGAGPVENYYVPVTQFEQAALKMENAILRYGAGKDSLDDVAVKYQVLQSKLRLLSVQSDSTYLLHRVPGYRSAVEKLAATVRDVGDKLDDLEGNRGLALEIADRFETMRAPLSDLEMSVGNAEAVMRDDMFSDYAKRRRVLVATSVGGLMVLAVLVGLLVVNTKRMRALMVQQRAALEREKEATQAAAEAVNARNAFLGMIGHELRTPLQSITAAIDVLTEKQLPEVEGALIKRLALAADQLDAQMKDLTDFSRINAGKLTLREQAFVPRDVLNAAVESVADKAKRKGLSLDARILGADGLYVSDPVRVQQIVTNLLTNAIKYTERGGVKLRATIERSGNVDRLAVEIEDTGPGFTDDKKAKIFEPFTQLDGSSTRRHDGIGMGLAIVRGLATLLGGSIRVSSTVGVGSQFTVTLPLKRGIGSLSAVAGGQNVSYRLEDKRLLVVDDHESVRESLRAMLAGLGVRFTMASSADEALKWLAGHRFDAVLLDVNMPGRDGVSVARAVRAEYGPNQRIPIVAVSAFAPELLTVEQRALFGEYLMKPLRADELRSALDKIFGGGTRL